MQEKSIQKQVIIKEDTVRNKNKEENLLIMQGSWKRKKVNEGKENLINNSKILKNY